MSPLSPSSALTLHNFSMTNNTILVTLMLSPYYPSNESPSALPIFPTPATNFNPQPSFLPIGTLSTPSTMTNNGEDTIANLKSMM